MNIRQLTLRATSFAISVLAFFITIEVCARIDDAIKYNAPFWKVYNDDILRSRDKDGDPFNLPNVGFEKWQHNSMGFRGPEFPVNKPPGTTRICCIGSSESYGLYESPGKEWPAQMQTVLSNSRYQVINASVAGITLPHYGPYLRKHVFPLKPDFVVFVINPYFYATIKEKSSNPSTTSAPQDKAKGRGFEVASIPSHLRILPKIKQVIKKTVSDFSPQLLERYQIIKLQRQVAALEHMELKGKKRKDTVPDSYVASFKTDLSKLVSLCQSSGINVLLTSYPTLMNHNNLQAYPVIFMDHNRFCLHFSHDGSIEIVDKFNAVISSVAKEHHLAFVDIAKLIPKSTEYFADNVHYTDQGSRMIAESIAQKILPQR